MLKDQFTVAEQAAYLACRTNAERNLILQPLVDRWQAAHGRHPIHRRDDALIARLNRELERGIV